MEDKVKKKLKQIINCVTKTNFTRPTDVVVGISRGLEKPPQPMP